MDFVRLGILTLMESGTDQEPDKLHPTIFVTNEFNYEKDGKIEPYIMLVTASTTKNGKPGDSTCQIMGGQYKLIPDDSWIRYEKTRIIPLREAKKEIQKHNLDNTGKFKHDSYQLIDQKTLDRICAGIVKSPETEKDIRKIYIRISKETKKEKGNKEEIGKNIGLPETQQITSLGKIIAQAYASSEGHAQSSEFLLCGKPGITFSGTPSTISKIALDEPKNDARKIITGSIPKTTFEEKSSEFLKTNYKHQNSNRLHNTLIFRELSL